ncbi:hypothetical protein [Enterocloster bolteae]|uniref:hypothetical protein n=1 Tax=Enterocloster bolteae TaxID=208479 RepID=UPI0028DCA01B|nr:hypothetical protein [Enterocloster bolteae]
MKKTQEEVLLTAAQAHECLRIQEDGVVHSYVKGFPGCYFGADLTSERIRKLLTEAEDSKSLYLVKDGIIGHNIKVWDKKTEEWIYLECKENGHMVQKEREHE